MIDIKSLLGYAHYSPFRFSPFLDIQTPGGSISMEDTPIDLLGIDNHGITKKMKAGRKKPYKFKGNQVREIPMQAGGQLPPIYTSNPNDPRLKAWQDSVAAYNLGASTLSKALNQGSKYVRKEFYGKPGKAEYSDPEWNYHGMQAEGRHVITNLPDGSTTGRGDEGHDWTPYYKKPVQPVIYQKPQQGQSFNPNIQWMGNSQNYNVYLKQRQDLEKQGYKLGAFLKSPHGASWQEYIDPNNPGHSLGLFIPKKPVGTPTPKEPVITNRGPLSEHNTPDLSVGNTRPSVAPPNFQRAEWDLNKPSPYNFTYPTGPYNEQKTINLPDEGSWKEFIKDKKEVSSQQGSGYGTATGYMQMGGNPYGQRAAQDIYKYIFSDDDEPTQEEVEAQQTEEQGMQEAQQRQENVVDDDNDLAMQIAMFDDNPYETPPQSYSNGTPGSMPGFRSFGSYEEGKKALIGQLELYKTGRTKNPVKPNSTLLQAMSVYAPASDGNNPKAYAEFIAKRLGISTNTPISAINTEQWANAIEKMEGNTKGNNPGNLRR